MTAGGWIIMLLSVGTVTVFFTWCMVKVMSAPNPEKPARFPIKKISRDTENGDSSGRD